MSSTGEPQDVDMFASGDSPSTEAAGFVPHVPDEASAADIPPPDSSTDAATADALDDAAAEPAGDEPVGAQSVDPTPEAPAPEAVEESADRLDDFDARVAAVENTMADIARSVAEIARLGQRHADHVAELHADNQRLRSGEITSVVAPIHRDIIRLHDEIQSLEEGASESGDLGLVRARVTDVLGRWGIVRHLPEVGDPFDSKVHQGVGRIESNDGPDGTVARVRRAGFIHEDGRTLRVAEVEVFRAVATATSEPDTPPVATEIVDLAVVDRPMDEPRTDESPAAREP